MRPTHNSSGTVLDADDPRHGTINGYINLGCRCSMCRDANRIRHADYINRLRTEGRTIGRHGSSAAYESGCRCAHCTLANTLKGRARRRRALQRIRG